jgi:hypothetical protein
MAETVPALAEAHVAAGDMYGSDKWQGGSSGWRRRENDPSLFDSSAAASSMSGRSD